MLTGIDPIKVADRNLAMLAVRSTSERHDSIYDETTMVIIVGLIDESNMLQVVSPVAFGYDYADVELIPAGRTFGEICSSARCEGAAATLSLGDHELYMCYAAHDGLCVTSAGSAPMTHEELSAIINRWKELVSVDS